MNRINKLLTLFLVCFISAPVHAAQDHNASRSNKSANAIDNGDSDSGFDPERVGEGVLKAGGLTHVALNRYIDFAASSTLVSEGLFTLDKIADGDSSDASPYNGFTTSQSAGTIRFDLSDGAYNVTTFELYNDINVRDEGIKDFRLEFFDANNSLLGVYEDSAPAGQSEAAVFTFDAVADVSRIDLVVLNSHPGFGLNRIEIREVAFKGETNVPVPAAIWMLGTGLLGLIGFKKKKS